VNPRERLLNVIQHKEVDRVPISTYELVGYNPDSWENKAPSYRRLMDYIREKTDCMYMWGVSRANTPKKELLLTREGRMNTLEEEILSVEEWIEGNSTFVRKTYHTPKGDLTTLSRTDEGIHTSWKIEPLLKTNEDIERYLSIPYEFEEPDISDFFIAQERLGEKGIILVSIADPVCTVSELFEFGDFMVRALTQKEKIIELLEVEAERHYQFLEYLLKNGVGPLFRICGPEYVTEPYLSPPYFGEFVIRYDKPIIDVIHEYGCFARFHCHGRLANVLDMIAAMEPDALDPIEAPPSGDITLGEVKRRYGDNICLMGNIQLRDLEYQTPEGIDRIVCEAMKAAKPGGGYVIMPTAAPINIPLWERTERNYFQFIDSALKYGQY